ncbi:MAG TPA: endonuclease/exonuclease/phosphatase family protein [Gemmatimonadaceae bacterium]
MRLATWNLERPRRGSVRRLPGLRARIATIDADVWVLTETNDEAVDLSASHPHRVSTDPIPGLHTSGERWTTIWSRLPAMRLETYDSQIAACARLDAPGGRLLVYGTVLPYHADAGRSGRAKPWKEFRRIVPRQRADWERLRAEFPDDRLCVAGDLNQSLDERRWHGRQWYGAASTRALLLDALAAARLTCVTAHDLVATGHLSTQSTIDHICIDLALADRVRTVGAWEAGCGDGVRLSDHNGVYVELAD